MGSEIIIKLLGIGSISLQINGITYFIDSFNDFTEPPDLEANDVVLFTHDDRDHYYAEALLSKINDSNLIIGPPTIALPLQKEKCINEDQLKISYPIEDTPVIIEKGLTRIFVYRTDHFLDWHAIHVSYLIESENRRIYIAGDSFLSDNHMDFNKEADCFILNLLKKEIVKNQMPREHGLFFHIADLLQIQYDYKPKLIIGNHLIGCNWAVDPKALQQMISANGIKNIRIPVDKDEEINMNEYV